MSPNSQAYRDAWARAKKAIIKEVFETAAPSTDGFKVHLDAMADVEHVLDDLACVVTRAVLGIEEDE